MGISTLTGALGVGGGLWWNTALNAGGGATQAQLNNWIYSQNNNVLVDGVTSGVAGGLGYWAGESTASWLTGSMQRSLKPVILGNFVGSGTSEGINAGLNKMRESNESNKNQSKMP